MICTNCGVQLSDDTRFCHECGAATNIKVNVINVIAVKEEEVDLIYKINVEEEPIDPEPLTKLELHYGGMLLFHFALEEKDGVVLFSCRYSAYIDKGYVPIEHEEVPVDPAYMQKLHKYAKEKDYIHLKPFDPSAPSDPAAYQIADTYMCSMMLKWGSRNSLSVDKKSMPSIKDLEIFFKGIAERITKQEI